MFFVYFISRWAFLKVTIFTCFIVQSYSPACDNALSSLVAKRLLISLALNDTITFSLLSSWSTTVVIHVKNSSGSVPAELSTLYELFLYHSLTGFLR